MGITASRIRRTLLGLWMVLLSLVIMSPAFAQRDTDRSGDDQMSGNSALRSLLRGFPSYGPSGTPLPAEEAARLVETLARAISAAHQARVIHRDLSERLKRFRRI